MGIARLAPKVLQAPRFLARSATYSFASFGVAGHAGDPGINAKPEDRDGAVKAFVEEVRPLADSGRLRLGPGLGLSADDLAPLGWTEADAALTAAGALAAAEVAGPLGGRTAAVVGSAPVAAAATDQLTATGADVAPARFDAECDVLFVAGKAGVLDHPTAEGVKATTIVPLTPVPVTARALAVLGRQERVVVPDFLSIAAPLLAADDPDGGDPIQRIRDATVELADQGTACGWPQPSEPRPRLAWTAEQPFGRPRPDGQRRGPPGHKRAGGPRNARPGRARRWSGGRARRRSRRSAPSVPACGCHGGCPATRDLDAHERAAELLAQPRSAWRAGDVAAEAQSEHLHPGDALPGPPRGRRR